jgi:uncharacterized protein YbjT (DUF2867 family)
MSIAHSPAILITGATGSIGTELCKQLSAQGVPFRAMVRSLANAQSLQSLKGAELVTGDFEDADSLKAALRGIKHAFLLTNSSEHAESLQSGFVDVAMETGLSHIVKLSQWAADLQSPVRYLRYHAAVEQKIKHSGIAYTFLRPNLFMQGLLGFREPIVKQGSFFAAIGDGKISTVDIRDIAAVAALTLKGGHEGKTYNLTGPEALTHQQMAAQLSKATGRDIRFVDVPPEVMLNALISAGFPNWQAEGLIEDYAHYSRGEAAMVTNDIIRLTGNRPVGFETFARDYAPAFS